MTNHDVVIVGGGPTGLALAAELALARVDVAIVERRATQELAGVRAGGLHARTLELLDQRGLAERFLAEGPLFRVAPFAGGQIEIGDLPSRHSYFLMIWQNRIEQLLADIATERGVTFYRDSEVAGFIQDEAGVTLSGTRTLRARYIVGCDGGRSAVRTQAGIATTGWDATLGYLIAEVSMREEPAWGMRRTALGTNAIGKLDEGKRARVVLVEPYVAGRGAATLDDLRDALANVYGTDFGVHDATWLSRFSDAARQATAYRQGRVLIAGDAAHVHSPVGGQGLNLGVQDAMNLGWKLACVIHGAPDALLDTYQAERHPVGARVLRTTLALTALARGDDRTLALQDLVGDLVRGDEARRRYAAQLSSLDLHYDLGAGHPLLGRRMPDLDLGTTRVYPLLHDGSPLLLNFGARLVSGVRTVNATYDGPWELPVVGTVSAPPAVLIRPDGHVAWVGDGTDRGLREATERWFGKAFSQD